MLPATDAAPMEIDVPLHIVVLANVAAAGSGLTVITTEFDLLQPVTVMVSTRV